MGKAVIVLDMLNDFVTGSLKCPRAQKIIPNIQKVIAAAREVGVPVIYSNDAHIEGLDHEFSVWGPHAIAGSSGAQVIPELEPKKGDYIVPKRNYSGFFGTDLDGILRGMGVEEVVLCGLHAHICVRHTSADAFFRGYDITVIGDAVESFTEEDYRSGLEYVKMAYKAKVVPSEEAIARLKG
ncbi:MAG: isochorismatase family cysteine hydrolase [Candidatus Micrarchaeia archaeon]